MSEEDVFSGPPRYLLPEGCKDLGDAPILPESLFVGSFGRPDPPKRPVALRELIPLLEGYLRQPVTSDPADFFIIELSPEDSIGVSLDCSALILRRPEWVADLDRVRQAAARHGLSPFQDSSDAQSHCILSFRPTLNPYALAVAVHSLLQDGFCLPADLPITYQAHLTPAA